MTSGNEVGEGNSGLCPAPVHTQVTTSTHAPTITPTPAPTITSNPVPTLIPTQTPILVFLYSGLNSNMFYAALPEEYLTFR